MNNRNFYEVEVSKILNQFEKSDVNPLEYYRDKTIDLVNEVNNVEVMKTIYDFVLIQSAL